MPKRPEKKSEDDDQEDDSENWKHDDPTERSPQQRRADAVRAHSESMIDTYRSTKKLANQIQESLSRNTWGHNKPLRYAA